MPADRKTSTRRPGFTLVELMVTVLIVMIVTLALGAVLAQNQIGWNAAYAGVNSEVASAGAVAARKFDAIVRNASATGGDIDVNGLWIELNYYSDDAALQPDCYARLYTSGDELKVEYGTLDPRLALATQTVCANVSACRFQQLGGSAQMTLTLDDGTRTSTTTTSAVPHNE